MVTTEGRYKPSATCWTCTRAICLSTTLHCCPNVLRLAYVQSSRTSTIFPCTHSFICRSGPLWARLHKTQHSHLPMGPPHNPDLPLIPAYHSPSMTTDDVQNNYQPQRNVTTISPPVAAPTYPTTPLPPPPVGLETHFLPSTGHYGQISRVPTPLSADSPSDGSEARLYDHNTSTRDSTSLTPYASNVHRSRRSLSRKS